MSWADLCLSTDVDSWHRLTITSIPLSDSDWNHVTGAPSFKPIAQHGDASEMFAVLQNTSLLLKLDTTEVLLIAKNTEI